jgi:hypothetical protein
MSPEKIIRALDAEANVHDIFSLAVVLAESHSDARHFQEVLKAMS